MRPYALATVLTTAALTATAPAPAKDPPPPHARVYFDIPNDWRVQTSTDSWCAAQAPTNDYTVWVNGSTVSEHTAAKDETAILDAIKNDINNAVVDKHAGPRDW